MPILILIPVIVGEGRKGYIVIARCMVSWEPRHRTWLEVP
jgi:hypothetical protein